MEAIQVQPTVLADVSKVQAHLRAAELVRAEIARRFGAAIATELVDRALGHEAVRNSAMPLTDLRAVVAGELLDRVGAMLVATGPAAFDEQARLDDHADRLTAPETPAALDRSEVRRTLAAVP